METLQKEKKILQWHPAFFAGLQIEFEKEAQDLIFENEHQLGTKPKAIDILVIKKQKEKPIQKNIGRIFRRHNIIEYKSPTDYLSIDDFYKVYGYACFYKSDTKEENSIRMEDITISLVSTSYPRKLMTYLTKERAYQVQKKEKGIYYILGDRIPMQILVTGQLSEKENLWLRSLTNHLGEIEAAKKLVEEYGKHKENPLYRSVMDIVVRANEEQFWEVKRMCEALEELMADELQAMRERGLEEGRKKGLQLGIEEGIEQGIEQGIKQGIEQGTERGRAEGLRILIETCGEIGLSREETLLKIQEKLSVSYETALGYITKYWK